ncbi:MAG: GNAT family N-acetyltransferase [Pseudomonadales bacterium]
MHDQANNFLAAPSLSKDNVRLELLSYTHGPGLLKHGNNADVFRYMPCSAFSGEQDVNAFIDKALREHQAGQRIPYAIVETGSGEAVGSSSFLALREQHRSVEIGWTWLGVEQQQTGVNTRCKYLLLTHAFEAKKCIRVEFKTDARNSASQRAIERIGAQREGVCRSHGSCPDGYIRDSVYYSITSNEWPQVKLGLENKLQ